MRVSHLAVSLAVCGRLQLRGGGARRRRRGRRALDILGRCCRKRGHRRRRAQGSVRRQRGRRRRQRLTAHRVAPAGEGRRVARKAVVVLVVLAAAQAAERAERAAGHFAAPAAAVGDALVGDAVDGALQAARLFAAAAA